MIKPRSDNDTPLNVLVQMAGGANEVARAAFSESLIEILHGPEADAVKPLATLDEGVCGYVFDLAPLRQNTVENDTLQKLLKSSLTPLPSSKLRIANTTTSPHEILDLILHVGIDIFDSHWAQQAANFGVALDFKFPTEASSQSDLGHNLYSERYTTDFTCFSSAFPGGLNRRDEQYCPCAACSPVSPPSQLRHSTLDEDLTSPSPAFEPPYTRAYVHHLLHTHEMSAHAFLAMHNLSILDAFFKGVRRVVADRGASGFEQEAARFKASYSEPGRLMEEAKKTWRDVDLARGKGRLARERGKNI
jgi:queuine/archaeosine tRNA-ribosyltransferase